MEGTGYGDDLFIFYCDSLAGLSSGRCSPTGARGCFPRVSLAGAVRAEAYIELWCGHAGTSAKRLRLNDGDWIDIGEP
jgi:hypothetical protein